MSDKIRPHHLARERSCTYASLRPTRSVTILRASVSSTRCVTVWRGSDGPTSTSRIAR
jgi:hypothetical protein